MGAGEKVGARGGKGMPVGACSLVVGARDTGGARTMGTWVVMGVTWARWVAEDPPDACTVCEGVVIGAGVGAKLVGCACESVCISLGP